MNISEHNVRKKFAQRLKELRLKKGISQEELAYRAKLSVSFISSIEQGINAPSFESLDAIASALEVSIKDLFDFNKTQQE